ncbi:MAG TPA: biotin carboxylase N-terminal domain-containing protein [Dehalococcoidia bacterium]|nr:biotin carboxylase N-terminal domain-containing protein [Dehalococcoidia bacterium]
MFRKVLIANRGEIALRIMRTCARMEIDTAAVYSDADRDALHVRRADEALRLGAARASESYLSIAAVVDAARRARADAIHPGYGFLSENPALPEACAAAGVTFIGPPAAAMRLLGDKRAARRLAARHGVAVAPGVDIEASGGSAAADAAASIGFPLMVKAAAGGGGRGMRLVASPEGLLEALAGARREAAAAFGDDRLFIERAIVGGRHVEVQVLADAHGHVVHLGERDCSVQRRHQKVVEESPAASVAGELREELGAAALTVARAAAYVNAGTVEFLLDGQGSFYFLEVNTRLQVEHPVTEMVTGLDLVELQLRIAAGEPLPFAQEDVRWHGHAIECRLCAEDPQRGYLPSSGRVTYFVPPSGDGIRVDGGIESGSLVPPEYDSLVAKLIVHASSRGEAIERCARALDAFAVEGVQTNLGLLTAVMTHPAFAAGTYDLRLLESMPPGAFASSLPDDVLLAAVAYDVGPFERARDGDPWHMLGAWRGAGWTRLEYVYQGAQLAVVAERISPRGDRWRMTIGERAHETDVSAGPSDEVIVRTSGGEPAWRVGRDGRHLILESVGRRYVLGRPAPSTTGVSRGAGAVHTGEMRAPMPGAVVRVLVTEGDRVSARQPLIILEAMKIEHMIHSTADGVVRRLHCRQGQRVAEGELLVEVMAGVEPDDAAP